MRNFVPRRFVVFVIPTSRNGNKWKNASQLVVTDQLMTTGKMTSEKNQNEINGNFNNKNKNEQNS